MVIDSDSLEKALKDAFLKVAKQELGKGDKTSYYMYHSIVVE